MKLVYICSPYKGDVEYNTAKAKGYCRFASKIQGVVPIAPHIYLTQFLEDGDPKERRLGLDIGLDLLKQCHELYVFGDRVSVGMQGEIEEAKRLGIPIIFYSDRCEKLDELVNTP